MNEPIESLSEKTARVKEQYPDEIASTKAAMEWRMDDADFQRVFQGIRRNPRLPQEYTKGMATACLYAIEWAVNHGMLVPRELLPENKS